MYHTLKFLTTYQDKNVLGMSNWHGTKQKLRIYMNPTHIRRDKCRLDI